MKPGPATSALADVRQLAQLFGELLRELARLQSGVLGKHHGGIGGEIAVARLARRLDHHAARVEVGTQGALGGELANGLRYLRGK